MTGVWKIIVTEEDPIQGEVPNNCDYYLHDSSYLCYGLDSQKFLGLCIGMLLPAGASVVTNTLSWTVKMRLCRASQISGLWEAKSLRPDSCTATTYLRSGQVVGNTASYELQGFYTFSAEHFVWKPRRCKSVDVYGLWWSFFIITVIKNLVPGMAKLMLLMNSVEILSLTSTSPAF